MVSGAVRPVDGRDLRRWIFRVAEVADGTGYEMKGSIRSTVRGVSGDESTHGPLVGARQQPRESSVPVRIEVGDLPRHLAEELLGHRIGSRDVAKDTADVDTHEATDATLESGERGLVAARDGDQQFVDVPGSVFDDDGPRGLLGIPLRRNDSDTRGAHVAIDVEIAQARHRVGS